MKGHQKNLKKAIEVQKRERIGDVLICHDIEAKMKLRGFVSFKKWWAVLM